MKYLSIMLVLASLISCKQRDGSETELHFQMANSSDMSAMEKLYDLDKVICVQASDDKTRAQGEKMVRESLADWFDLLKKIDPNIPTNYRFACPLNGRYFTVHMLRYAARSYHKGNSVFLHLIYLNGDEVEPLTISDTLRHEIGHAFGLGDTYLGGNRDQPNQPMSTMNNNALAPNDDVFPDTKYGMAALYAKYFAKRLTYNDKVDKLLFALAKTGGDIESRCYSAQQTQLRNALKQLSPDELRRFVDHAPAGDGQLATLENGGYWGANKIGAKWENNKLVVGFTDWGKSSSVKDAHHEGAAKSIQSSGADIDCAVTSAANIRGAILARPR